MHQQGEDEEEEEEKKKKRKAEREKMRKIFFLRAKLTELMECDVPKLISNLHEHVSLLLCTCIMYK